MNISLSASVTQSQNLMAVRGDVPGTADSNPSPEESEFVRSWQNSDDLEFLDSLSTLRRTALSKGLKAGLTTSVKNELVELYPGRNGYDTSFLGSPLPLPSIPARLQDQVATLVGQPGQSELKYTNFSIVMNKQRRQAFFTAVNIDGASSKEVGRDGKWAIDGRIAREHQLGNEAYQNNPIDRGHMVRRSDPVWGTNGIQASRDTFAYTNAALQHESLNQKEWLDLENHVLETARSKKMKMTVMTGPVLRDDDPKFDNKGAIKPATQMPEEFWKVVVWNDSEKGLTASAFVLSQEDYIGQRGLVSDGFEPGRFSVYQVPMSVLEEITGLDFAEVAEATTASKSWSLAEDSLAA